MPLINFRIFNVNSNSTIVSPTVELVSLKLSTELYRLMKLIEDRERASTHRVRLLANLCSNLFVVQLLAMDRAKSKTKFVLIHSIK
jgi:hypothetical protein